MQSAVIVDNEKQQTYDLYCIFNKLGGIFPPELRGGGRCATSKRVQKAIKTVDE